jgi:transposase-like protein
MSGMEFTITNLLDPDGCQAWLIKHLHPNGFGCPQCGQPVSHARSFRQTRRSQLTVYRCRNCDAAYNLYSGTALGQHHVTPRQVVLLLRGICKGEPTSELAMELGLSYKTVLELRHTLQANAERMQPTTPLPDGETETDEMFQNAGEKR